MKIVENCSIIGDAVLAKNVSECGYHKYNYARTLCHFASLALEFYDAWHEGDGVRIIRCYHLLLPHMYQSGRTKYSFEITRLLIQLQCLPANLTQQLIWDRFINTHSGMGHNLPCDLHNEHVNKLLKEVIRHMATKFSQKALTSAARSVTYMASVATNFDQQCGITPESTAHQTKDDAGDVKRVMEVVRREEL